MNFKYMEEKLKFDKYYYVNRYMHLNEKIIKKLY